MAAINQLSSEWIRRFHPSPEAVARLLCFAHAGGSASYFFPVSRAMAPAVEVLAVQYPGRQERRAERCIEDIGELADRIAEAVRPWTGRPLALFGHSMGATVAFEVALRLERDGIVPAGLFASGRRAPSLYKPENVHRRPDDRLLDELRELSGTDAELLADEEFVQLILPPLRSDYRAVQSYRHQPGARLACPVDALAGEDDPKASAAEMQAWRGHTTGPFALHLFTGGHFYLNDHMPEITGLIAARLPAGAGAGGPGGAITRG